MQRLTLTILGGCVGLVMIAVWAFMPGSSTPRATAAGNSPAPGNPRRPGLPAICDQGPLNPPTLATTNLDEFAADWGVFCENAPAWVLENVTTPSLDGMSLRCGIAGGSPNSNVHCYRNLLPEPSTRFFTLTLSFRYSPTSTCNNLPTDSIVQALEFSISKWHQAKRYELALQWENVGTGAPQWRYWDPRPGNLWVSFNPPISAPCLPGDAWHTFELNGEIVNDQVHYRRFIVDSDIHPLDIIVPPAGAPGEPDRLAVAVQLDGTAAESPYDLFIDKVNFFRDPFARIFLPFIAR